MSDLAKQQRKERAINQRIYLIDEEYKANGTITQFTYHVLGTTGNAYHIIFEREISRNGRMVFSWSCTCPDYTQRHNSKCKHIYFIKYRLLKDADDLWKESCHRYEHKLSHTKLLETDCVVPREITDEYKKKRKHIEKEEKLHENKVKRRPYEDEVCPICIESFTESDEITYCKLTCGTNFHKECLTRWKTIKDVCPACRSPLSKDDSKKQKTNNDQYINLESIVNKYIHQ